MATKEEVIAAMMGGFKRADVPIHGTVVTLFELSTGQMLALDNERFEKNADGTFKTVEGRLVAKADGLSNARWVAAASRGIFSVDEISQWPDSVVDGLAAEAVKLTIEPKAPAVEAVEAAVKNS